MAVTEVSRAAIIAAARGWIGTPYHHQAALKGVGCDCIGLIRGIWREIHGEEPETVPAYSPDWGDADKAEDLLAAGHRHLTAIPVDDARPGDVIAFRWRDGSVAKHSAILTAPDRIVHAYNRGGVVEVTLSRWWRDRMVAAFRFPGVVD